jgi:hypothetical protein
VEARTLNAVLGEEVPDGQFLGTAPLGHQPSLLQRSDAVVAPLAVLLRGAVQLHLLLLGDKEERESRIVDELQSFATRLLKPEEEGEGPREEQINSCKR